jgi:serine O-acetyltransferase
MTTDSTIRSLEKGSTRTLAEEHPNRLNRWRALLQEDIETIFHKDPAARSRFEVLTCYPGLHAIWLHRVAHGLWKRRHLTMARFISHMGRFLTGIEIHPGAQIGRRFFIDHGAGVVIGETAIVGDDVLMYQGAVLGGTSSERVKRHPTIGHNVVIGAHAIILGDIAIGDESKVGSGSVVVQTVPNGATVVGVPGRVTRINGRRLEPQPRDILDHSRLPDPVVETLRCLVDRIELLEHQVRDLTPITPVDWEGELSVECALFEEEIPQKGPLH